MEEIKKFLCSPPQLRNKSNSRWYIEWYLIFEGNIRVRQKRSFGINRGKTDEERLQLAQSVIDDWHPEKWVSFPLKIKTSEIPLHACISQYLSYQKIIWKPRTYDTYLSKVKEFSDWCSIKNIDPKKVNEDTAKIFMQYIVSAHTIGNTTYNAYRATLHTMYRSWKETRRNNPFEFIPRKRESKTPQKSFTLEQRCELIAYIEAREEYEQLHVVISLMFYAYTRVNETRQLKMGDVDFEKRIIHINAFDGKTNRIRKPPIPHQLYRLLEKRRNLPEHYYVAGRNEKPAPKNGYYTAMSEVLHHFGYGHGYSLYSWRHTAAIDLYEQYRDIYLVKEAMGHTTVSTTEKYLRNLNALKDERLFRRNDL